MPDIWSGIGVEISKNSGEWLYRLNGEVRGPVPQEVLVKKLLQGELDVNTPIALEGGDFNPMVRVKLFTRYVQEAQKKAAERSASKVRRIVALVVVLVLMVGGVVGFFLYDAHQRNLAEVAKARRQAEAAIEKKRLERQKAGDIGLVALVTLGTEEEVQIKSDSKRKTGARKTPRTKAEAAAEAASGSDKSISDCERSTGSILSTLGQHVGKLNVCVAEEKKRASEGPLPARLEIDFVVKPDGKVVDFKINDRHYRTGILNNCMIKAFNTIRFPSAGGSNCPITLPLNIGQ